ncbi:MAG: hypothetical protein ACKV22_23445 [Bryobacteraceae bacterium]
MSFSDNLENTLKNLEARGERETPRGRKAKRAAALPVENLRTARFTSELLSAATRIGHGIRTKVHIAWIGPMLRLDAREHRLELRPSGEGVIAHFLISGTEKAKERIDLNGKAETLARRWLDSVGPPPPPPPFPVDLSDDQ